MRGILFKAFLVGLAFAGTPALAQIPLNTIPIADSADTAWVLVASFLVLLAALPGLALFIAGQVRGKNTLSVFTQIGAIAAMSSLIWIVIGYSISFAVNGGDYIGSAQNFMFNAMADVMRADQSISELVFALFRMMTAIFAAALIVGALAERVRFGWILSFAALWSLLVFAPVSRWIWGQGWLSDALDFGGGIVVLTSAGVSALVAALMLGRRGEATQGDALPNATKMSLIGMCLLWAGWFGIVGGATLSASGDDAARVIINTHLGASVAMLVWAAIERVRTGKISGLGIASGAIAGLAVMTPAADVVGPGGATIMAALAAVICYSIGQAVRNNLKIDDVANIFGLFGVGGITGSLLLAIFASEGLGGVGYVEGAGMASQLWLQVKAVAVVAAWSAVVTLIIGYMVAMVIPMRVSEAEERQGLDVASHGAGE